MSTAARRGAALRLIAGSNVEYRPTRTVQDPSETELAELEHGKVDERDRGDDDDRGAIGRGTA